MTKTFEATWLGDQDPLQQSITYFGIPFVKGEPVKVPSDHPYAAKVRGNPMFSSEKDAEVVASVEPTPPDPEAGTELEAAKKEAELLGIKLGAGNHKVETVRAKIAEHHVKIAAG